MRKRKSGNERFRIGHEFVRCIGLLGAGISVACRDIDSPYNRHKNTPPKASGGVYNLHQAGAPVFVLLGLTLLNRTARSGVVSGQSASKVIGIFRAFSSSFISSSVNASSFFISSFSSIIFTIIQPPFKIRRKPGRNQSRHFCLSAFFIQHVPFRIHNKQNIIDLIIGKFCITNHSTANRKHPDRCVPDRIIPILIQTVFFII